MRTYSLTVHGKSFDVKVLETGPDLVRVEVNNQEIAVEVNEIVTQDIPTLLETAPDSAAPTSSPLAGGTKRVSEAAMGSAGDAVTSPIPGQIIRILVREGDRVAAGQKLLILEAMKLENKIVAHKDGLVKKILVRDGDTVSQGQQLVRIQ